MRGARRRRKTEPRVALPSSACNPSLPDAVRSPADRSASPTSRYRLSALKQPLVRLGACLANRDRALDRHVRQAW